MTHAKNWILVQVFSPYYDSDQPVLHPIHETVWEAPLPKLLMPSCPSIISPKVYVGQ